MVHFSSKEFLYIQATMEHRFTLKRVRDTIITYSYNLKSALQIAFLTAKLGIFLAILRKCLIPSYVYDDLCTLLKNLYSTIIKPAVLAAYQIKNLKKGSNLLDDGKINIGLITATLIRSWKISATSHRLSRNNFIKKLNHLLWQPSRDFLGRYLYLPKLCTKPASVILALWVQLKYTSSLKGSRFWLVIEWMQIG